MNLIVNPDSTLTFLASGMLSATGRCRVFSADADGYIRAEGLRGRRAGKTEPRERPGAWCMDSSWARRSTIRARAPASACHALERKWISCAAHTLPRGFPPTRSVMSKRMRWARRSGDMMEIEAIEQVFSSRRAGGGNIPVGSLKTNFGHTEAASGIAGLMKGMSIANHRKIPPNLHFKGISSRARKSQSVLQVPEERQDVAADRVVVGISTFGATGSNGHLIVSADRL